MTQLELREGDVKGFFDAPRAAYGDESPFVSVFDTDLRDHLSNRNPLLKAPGSLALFTVHRGSVAVGRITAHAHDASNRRYGWNRASFGYFDCADDPEAARMLLAAAERWSLDRGHDEIWGNFNLTAMQQMGVATGGFDEAPYSDQIFNSPHIPRHLEANGYAPEFPMTSFEIDLRHTTRADAPGASEAALQREGFRFVTLGTRRIERLFPALCDTLNDGFSENPFFVPLSLEEFQFQARDLSWVIDPRISWLAYEGSEIVGALIIIPDLNPLLRRCRSRMSPLAVLRLLAYRRRPDRAVVIFQSVRRRLHHRGIGAALIQRSLASLRSSGYKTLGVTWVSDQNRASLAGVRRAGGRPMHRLHLFRKALR